MSYSQSEADLLRDNKQLQARVTELEGAVKALPLVEGEIRVRKNAAGEYTIKGGYGYFIDYPEAEAYAALLALRAGMK